MTLQINETRFHYMSESPNGAVGLHLAKTGLKIESAAKALATTEGLVRTGRYRASIFGRLHAGAHLLLAVGAAGEVARYLEHGTPPHAIVARRRVVNALGNITPAGRNGFPTEGGLFWEQKPNVGGRGWFVPDHPLQAVNHPGTRPYMILHRAVASVLRKGGTA